MVVGDARSEQTVAAQVVTGDNGQFDYNGVDRGLGETWSIRLTDYPSVAVTLDVETGVRYLVEFDLD